jgi:hypothetical protein
MNGQIADVIAPVVTPDSTERVWPTYDHDIGLTEARELISRWKRANPEKASASAFTKVAVDRVLAQPGCTGVRLYFGLNPDGTMALIGVGVDEFGNDMDDGELMERSFLCPPICPMDSALDS